MRGKSCVITGAAAGIGRATAERFVKEGALVVAADVDAERLRTLEGVTTVVGDIASPEDAKRMIQAAVDEHGRIDVLVANAGIFPLMTVQQAEADDWDRVMAVNGRGTFLTCKYAIEAMLETGGGAIVCVSSTAGAVGQPRQVTYGPAKFAVSGLTKHLAVECADKGIRVNAVAPGAIRTEKVRMASQLPGMPEQLEKIAQAHPMKRFGDPGEVAAAILFLASDEASYITGAVLPVDGGYVAQ